MKLTTKRLATLAGSTALMSAVLMAPAFAGTPVPAPAPAAPVPARGYVDVPANTVISFGGYVKADFIYDFTQRQGDTIFAPSLIRPNPITTNQNDGGFRFHARQTRFNFTSVSQTGIGEIKARFEVDFFGGGGNQGVSNSFRPRMRHATIQFNGWTFGQTWTLFMPLSSYTGTVDFEGPSGLLFVRQAQVRYTHRVNDMIQVAVSVENPEVIGDGGNNDTNEAAPDFVGAVRLTGAWGSVDIAGIFLPQREDNSPVGVAKAGSDDGYGAMVGAALSLWPGGHLDLNGEIGSGIGRYMVSGVSADISANAGRVKTINVAGFSVGVSQALSPTLTAGLVYGYDRVTSNVNVMAAAGGAAALKNTQTIHGTLFFTPAERLSIGAEVSWAQAGQFNGIDGDNVRAQVGVKMGF